MMDDDPDHTALDDLYERALDVARRAAVLQLFLEDAIGPAKEVVEKVFNGNKPR